ncbi:MAG: hypothetical protein QM783_06225 [Phycisphaerales bacterium]
MHFVKSVVPVLGIAAFAATSLADVSIVYRLSNLTQGYSPDGPLPGYNDSVFSTALGAVTLTTDHGESFTSNVTNQLITAQLHGTSSFGGPFNPYHSGTTTSLDVIFEVTGAPVDVSIRILTGSSSVIQTNPAANPRGNVQLRLLDNVTNQQLFNSDSNMNVHTGIPWYGDWNNALWTTTLAPGTYHITSLANGTNTYSAGGGSGSGGGGSMNVQITFTPTPGAAAALSLLAPIAARRRRA